MIAPVVFFMNASAQYSNKQGVADFHAVEVSSAARVELVQSDSDYVVITSKNPIQKMQNIEVEGGVLKITSPLGGKVEVHVRNLTSIKVSDAARVTCKDTLKSDNLTIRVSDAGSAEIKVHAKILEARSRDASKITLSGTADSLSVGASDGARIDADELKALHAHAMSSDGSNISVWAINSIGADATDGSNIHVKGSPALKNTTATDGGSVSMEGNEQEADYSKDRSHFVHVGPDSNGKKKFVIDGDAFISMGFVTGGTQIGAPVIYGSSREFTMGFGYSYSLAKWNALGWDIYYKSTDYYLKQDSAKTFPDKTLHESEKISFQNFGGLIYDRFYIGKKLFLDGGIYGDWTFHSKLVTWDANVQDVSSVKTTDRNLSFVNATNYGLNFRVGFIYGISLYFNYRLSGLFQNPAAPAAAYPELPAYTVGITLGSF